MDYVDSMQAAREAKLLACLKVLGNTPKVIAQSLVNMKIKGLSRDNENCPLAMYLKRERYKNVSVGHSVVNCETRSGVSISVDLPKGCSDFVEKFDDEEYSNLLK